MVHSQSVFPRHLANQNSGSRKRSLLSDSSTCDMDDDDEFTTTTSESQPDARVSRPTLRFSS